MLTKVARIEKPGGHRLRFYFADGSAGEHDFSTLVAEEGPMVEPLRDPVYFARVFLEAGAPTWPNGYDMAPEWVRRLLEVEGALKRPAQAV